MYTTHTRRAPWYMYVPNAWKWKESTSKAYQPLPRPLHLKLTAPRLAGWLLRSAGNVVLFNAARLSDSQRHLRELGRLDRSYHETLERDRKEREVQVQVQKENSSLTVGSLRRRYVRYVCTYNR